MQKSNDFALRIERQVVDRRRFILFYRVEQRQGDWLWLKADGKALNGWVKADQVVPVEKGIAFFTEEIMPARMKHSRTS